MLSASMTVAMAEEIKLLFLEFQSAGVTFQQTLKRQSWGAKAFVIKDPDGICCCLLDPQTKSHHAEVLLKGTYRRLAEVSERSRNGLGKRTGGFSSVRERQEQTTRSEFFGAGSRESNVGQRFKSARRLHSSQSSAPPLQLTLLVNSATSYRARSGILMLRSDPCWERSAATFRVRSGDRPGENTRLCLAVGSSSRRGGWRRGCDRR